MSWVFQLAFAVVPMFPIFSGLSGKDLFAHNGLGQQLVQGSAGTAYLSFHLEAK